MKVLFTGKGGKAGTWHMRGVQMAATNPEWKAIPNATDSDIRASDVVVIVKRIGEDTLRAIKSYGCKVVYDPLDFWHQPEEALGIGTPQEARAKFKEHFDNIGADIVLVSNAKMKFDLEPIVKRAEILHHHYDPSLTSANPHTASRTIIYWGHPRYLGEWNDRILRVCNTLKYSFKVNPVTLNDCHAMIAVRGGQHGSWLARRWKSCVKGAAAQRIGVPLIAWPEWSYVEACGNNLFQFTDEDSLLAATKSALQRRFEFPPCEKLSLEACATKLKEIIEK